LKKAINNKKYIVWKVRKEKEDDDKNDASINLPDRYEDGTWHLLLLKHHTPFVQA
jgi:hypothetical protein